MTLDTLPVEVLGFADHATYRERWPLLGAIPNVWDKVRSGAGALVSEQLARRLKVNLGDRVMLPAATGPWQVEVAGIYPDYGNPKGQIGIDIDALAKRWPEIPPHAVRVARLRRRRCLNSSRPFVKNSGLDTSRLLDQATLKAESTRIFNRTFSVTSALNAFTLGVAGVALLTSLLTLSNSRLPQLAPLWALGLTRRRLAGIELLKTMSVCVHHSAAGAAARNSGGVVSCRGGERQGVRLASAVARLSRAVDGTACNSHAGSIARDVSADHPAYPAATRSPCEDIRQ